MNKLIVLFLLGSLASNAQVYQYHETLKNIGDKGKADIYFDLLTAVIRPESYPLMDSIAKYLKENDSLMVEIGVHVDHLTYEQRRKYSTSLSYSRAVEIKSYLVNKGIDERRLIAKSYGDRYPIVTEEEIEKLQTEKEKEAARRKNRRVEMKVLRTDFYPHVETDSTQFNIRHN